jgi:type IV secretory pathway VirB10-like protein
LLTGLVRFVISLVMLAAFVWFAVTVPLGKRTLWGHVHAIFATQEAKDLADGTKEEAEKVAQKVKQELHHADMAEPPDAPPVAHKPTAAQTAAPAPTPKARPRHVRVPLPAR